MTAGSGHHISCTLAAVLLARVRAFGGEEAVAEVLKRSGSARPVEYFEDLSNWISFEEADSLFTAGAEVTHHPQFARAVGEDAVKRLKASQVATLLRSLGSPEDVYRQIALTSSKYSVVTRLDPVEVRPGYAEIEAVSMPGFGASAHYCSWRTGLLSITPVLFGLPPATISHEQCQAFGAQSCRYVITWQQLGTTEPGTPDNAAGLREQVQGMNERLRSMFATASDLIASDDLSDVLARITDRAATEIRAPRYLLAVRTAAGKLHFHHKGFDDHEAAQTAEHMLDPDVHEVPDSWLVVPVRSQRRDYGRLMAMYDSGSRFFPQERELFEVYARYAASALDSATALVEAKEAYAQSSALLDLARALASAGTSDEVAARLAEAVPLVVDCDRVGVYLWNGVDGVLSRRATSHRPGIEVESDQQEWQAAPSPGGPLEAWLRRPTTDPIFVDRTTGHPVLRELTTRFDAVANIVVPLATPESLLGVLMASVLSGPERLDPTPDLLDRLSGLAAQATSALQNGRLVDQITHQARHDQLTGLANRLRFGEQLRAAMSRAREQGAVVQLYYIDLDRFKPVNDEFGHAVGDRLLAAVGERLKACTRPGDTVARLGGDEFAVLIETAGAVPDSERLGERLVQTLEQPFDIDGHLLTLGASVGRAAFPDDGIDPDALVRAADAAMFAAKRGHQQGYGLPLR